ncbi:MAG: AAA domain-containing protein [Chitinophagales bacterium]|nr:AAA domain-containing protein [Chitinophagales bacterium]
MKLNPKKIKTLGELKEAGYQSRSIKDELRENLINKIQSKEKLFDGILGYDDTVLPDIERAILSRHNIILLGLRGQAKTRIARQMTELLDEYIPYVRGSELNDDPLNPLSVFSRELIEEHGDDTQIKWLHRSQRYSEKLATPDVSVADLIGDLDPIKAANQRLSYSDERVIHFGLIPRSNRHIFVINELPDLQARIQVALFNILQEGDIQIRGFKLRLPLDMQFVFTANPEDYTNRGSIVTPLKDRVESQILTHYPKTLEISRSITEQETQITEEQKSMVYIPELAKNIIEQVAIQARDSEYIDNKSGVSARLTISAYENLISAAERRSYILGEKNSAVRMSDFWGIIPAITGKIELVYEGEQEGPYIVAQNLIGKAIRAEFLKYLPDPDGMKKRKKEGVDPYAEIKNWFGEGNVVEVLNDLPSKKYLEKFNEIPHLRKLVLSYFKNASKEDIPFLMEFTIHGLAEFSQLSKNIIESGISFKDLLSSVFTMENDEEF